MRPLVTATDLGAQPKRKSEAGKNQCGFIRKVVDFLATYPGGLA
jgi:hypothetical protein